jgi:hypothetical protein
MTIPSPTLQIEGPDALRKNFEAWLTRFPYPNSIDADSQYGLLAKGFALGEHRVPVLFALAKSLLFAGQWKQAQKLILEIRAEDRPEIYFLGAVAFLTGSKSLHNIPSYSTVAQVHDFRLKAKQECVFATDLLLAGRDLDLLPAECRRFLQQVVSCDTSFLGKLLAAPTRVHALATLITEGEQHPFVVYAKAAAASLELLWFAETIEECATKLPSSGGLTNTVKRQLNGLFEIADRVAFTELPPPARFKEVRTRFS